MILQTTLPYDPFQSKGLPGISPLKPEDWLHPDECAAEQIRLRRRLMAERTEDVLQMDPSALGAAQELLETVRDHLFPAQGDRVRTATGNVVTLDYDRPLESLGLITQQDFCILQKPEGREEHLLTAAVLCFPASWRLAEKFMRPLTQIHAPVAVYDAQIAKRVQRLFDGVQVDRPLWRFNALWYDSADLYHPDRDPVAPHLDRDQAGTFLRSELQTVKRLPRSRAVIFSIHTRLLTRANALAQFAPSLSSEG